jgi:general secretion pathway protein C
MLSASPDPWIVRGATFALWALAAGSAVFWGLRLAGSERSLSVPASPARQVAAVDPEALARLLGSSPVAGTLAAPPPLSLASRFQLVGVAAAAHSGAGAAVISVDGKPARPFRVGSTIEEGVVLQSVRGRQAVLASGATQVTLELPRVRAPLGAQAPIAAPR